MSVKDRVVAITGATGGLGRVAASRMAAEGARLALLSSNQENLDALAAELQLPAERVLPRAADLRDPAATREAIQAVVDKFGRVEILLHVVGGWAGGQTVAEVAQQTVEDMLQQHLWTTLYLMQATVPHMLSNGWGRLLAVSSPYAAHPQAKGSAYAVGKAAQEALFMALAEEVKDSGVTANLLLARTIDAKHERDKERTAKNAAWTTPEEIVAAMLYLCSDEARTVNGARIPLYGRP